MKCLVIYKGNARGLRAYLHQLIYAMELKDQGLVDEVLVIDKN